MRAVSEARARLETRVPVAVHVSRIHRVRVSCADASARLLRAQGNHGPICPSDIAAACSTVAGARVVHVPCSSSGAGAGVRRQTVPTVLGSAAAAVDDGVTEVSQGSWSVAVAVLI